LTRVPLEVRLELRDRDEDAAALADDAEVREDAFV
jgi:hypothetical protein